MTRKTYLEDIPLEEALTRFLTALEKSEQKPLREEIVQVEDSESRVTAGPVWAKMSSPHYHASAMDGIAVNAAETLGASRTAPMRLKVGGKAFWVDTGNAMP